MKHTLALTLRALLCGSIGTATFGVHGETLDQLVVAADNEMYRMKSDHRSTRIGDELISTDLQDSPAF